MKPPDDVRPYLYAHYVAQSATASGYHPNALPEYLGDALYGRHLVSVDRRAPVIEIGTGAGHFLAYLRQKGFEHLSGVDLSEELVAQAQAQGLAVTQGDGICYLADQPDASCGAVVAVDVVEHLTKSELLAFFKESLRVLQPGGVLLIQTVNGQGLFPGQIAYGDLTHETILNPGSLGRTLTTIGFTDLSFHESGPLGRTKMDSLRRLAWRMVKRMLNFLRWIEARKRQDVWTENMICCAHKAGPGPA